MDYQTLNSYLVKIFNNILVIEEASLRTSRFSDVTLKEMHTLDVIGSGVDVTPSDVAREMMVTLGTVTVSLNRLESKGYLTKERSEKDRRVVYLSLTKKGRVLYRSHQKFHKKMVEQITAGMDDKEVSIMLRGLVHLHDFLEDLK